MAETGANGKWRLIFNPQGNTDRNQVLIGSLRLRVLL